MGQERPFLYKPTEKPVIFPSCGDVEWPKDNYFRRINEISFFLIIRTLYPGSKKLCGFAVCLRWMDLRRTNSHW